MIKLVAADLTAEVREQSLGVTADARDHLLLLHRRLFAMRYKQLGTSLAADKQAIVPIATACRDAPRPTDVDTLGQATTPALGGQADWAGLPISFEKLRWQISTHYFTVTLELEELEDALEVDVTKLLMYSLDVLSQSGII